jgi:hypothetical protein
MQTPLIHLGGARFKVETSKKASKSKILSMVKNDQKKGF